ncbi:MAG: DUF6266 family protein [Daejeonella sp.]|uniref:DUF6266 family protein n=1 Tax=Daejeonella sp. TaxID=2805397 RepID=UPI003C708B5E
MARLINGANGPFSGKVGSIIGYTMNGVGYMKGPYKLRTKAPTAGELLNREKFAAAQSWLSPALNMVRAGFKGYKPSFQGFSAAKSWLMKNALQVIDGKVVIDPSLVKISSGSLRLPEDLNCTFEEPDMFRFKWKPTAPSVLEREQVMVLIYNIEKGVGYGYVYGNNLSHGEQLVKVELFKGGTTLHCYLAVLATDRSNQSDSVYLGKFEIGYD